MRLVQQIKQLNTVSDQFGEEKQEMNIPRASVAPQALMTQVVEALCIAASLLAEHWQARSVAPQVVAEATASAIH